MSIPKHVAVIMDGNGRWAQKRFMPRIEGHRRGISAMHTLVETARECGLKNLTVFAFSSENWKRPADEVKGLMRFFVSGLRREAEPLREAGVRLRVVGDRTGFDQALLEAIDYAQTHTAACEQMQLNICINYGGRWDIAQAAQSLAQEQLPITVEALSERMSMPWSGPVDLMIRTGGEQRISNFILWQAAYAELWFTPVLWPEFGADDLRQALAWYDGRERRFGMTGEQVRA